MTLSFVFPWQKNMGIQFYLSGLAVRRWVCAGISMMRKKEDKQ